MALAVAVGSFAQPAATGNQAVSVTWAGGVSGVTPVLVLFWMNQLTADGSATSHQEGRGAAASSSSRGYVSGSAQSGNATDWKSVRRITTSFCIGLVNLAAATVQVEADFVSFASDQFTVNWTTVDATARIVNFLALGGSDVTGASVHAISMPASTGNAGFTGPGFLPTGLILFGEHGTATPETATGSISAPTAMGVAASTTSRGCVAGAYAGATVQSAKYQRTALCFAAINDTVVFEEADFVSFDTNGYTLNFTTTTSGRQALAVAVKGVKFSVQAFNAPTGTGPQSYTGAGFGYAPSAVVVASANVATSASVTSLVRHSIGAGASSTQRFAMHNSGSNAGTTSASEDLKRAALLRTMTQGGATPTLTSEADLTSLDSDGMTLSWTTADATAREVLALYLAAAAAPFVPYQPWQSRAPVLAQ